MQQLTEGRASCFPMQCLASQPRRVAEGPALRLSRQQVLLEQPIQRGHHCGIGKISVSALQQLANCRTAARPQGFEQALLQRAELPRRTSKWMEEPLHLSRPPEDSIAV